MRGGVAVSGAPSMEELEGSPGFPSKERLVKEAVAVIECVQEIPCDVCGSICPHNAIEVASVKSLPRLVEEECTGCGVCIPFCPGLAIFLVDYNYSRGEALISFPHEFQPLPEVGASVEATDRRGRSVTKGRVVRVMEKANYDGTVVVSIAVPKKFAQLVRGIKLLRGG
jgi:Fe-S-cluster-containing hydrogenase component 2